MQLLQLGGKKMNKYQEAFNALCDEDEMYKIAKGFSFEDDYTSEYDYEKAKEYCKNVIQELIDNYVWIPVEERLPENEKDIGRNYLVTLKYSNLNSIIATCARFEPSGRWLRYCAIGEVDVTDEVIAWMPLP